MNNIYPEILKNKLNKKLHLYYIFLGEDILFLKNNQKMICQLAYKQGFIKKNIINIEKNIDWNQIINFYQTRNLFDKKNILIINLLIKITTPVLIKNINQISPLFHKDNLVILKCYKLSSIFLEKNNLHKLYTPGIIISCFTLKKYQFIKWVKYEIQKKNINIDQKSYLLICKNYEGNTIFVSQILDILFLIWPKKHITIKETKKIINNFSIYSPIEWINSIFNGDKKKSLDILHSFSMQKYNPLILIRCLQKDILKLLFMKKEKKININKFIQKKYFSHTRSVFFIHACKYIQVDQCIKAIKILVQIEIKIKKKYDNDIWLYLKTLTLLLISQ
ncbi:DNA polymerase III subunit delta [Buchnera aphidicola]|uniref:DNA polymerase III subunit delta n=1 Tax=Buchnera aphidicola TaxID=9 RepID=UPI003BEF4BB1